MNNSHTLNEYNEELENLKAKVLNMGGIVEEQFSNATKSLLNADITLAEEIINKDKKVNSLENEIDEECAVIIARRAPTAIDLRNLFVIIKIVTDLERIGDESAKIAQFTTELEVDTKSLKDNSSKIYETLKSMIRFARDFLNDAMDCYARLDIEKATEISKLDIEIDAECEKLNRLLSTYLLEDSKNIASIVKVMWCSRAIERVGDHAKNIAEYINYIVAGENIRHSLDNN